MDTNNLSVNKLHNASHRLFDAFFKTIQSNVSLFIKRQKDGPITLNAIATILAHIELLKEGVSDEGWENDIEKKKSTYKSQFSKFQKKVMSNDYYFQEGDLQRLRNMIHHFELIISEPECLDILKVEHGLSISILHSNFGEQMKKTIEKHDQYKMDLENFKFKTGSEKDMAIKHDNETLQLESDELVDINEILLVESEELVREMIYQLPSNLLYEINWTPLEEHFLGYLLIKGKPVVLNFDTFDRYGDYPFMLQCGLLIVRRPSSENDILEIFQYNHIPDTEMGGITSISTIPSKKFYSYLDSFIYDNNINYLSPDQKEKLLQFVNSI